MPVHLWTRNLDLFRSLKTGCPTLLQCTRMLIIKAYNITRVTLYPCLQEESGIGHHPDGVISGGQQPLKGNAHIGRVSVLHFAPGTEYPGYSILITWLLSGVCCRWHRPSECNVVTNVWGVNIVCLCRKQNRRVVWHWSAPRCMCTLSTVSLTGC